VNWAPEKHKQKTRLLFSQPTCLAKRFGIAKENLLQSDAILLLNIQ